MMTSAPTRHSNFPLLAFCILHSAFCICLADPVPVRFNADAAAPQTFQAAAYRGETLDIEARLTLRGAPLAVADGASATMHWQTNGMGAAWWTAPASVTTSGLVRARWTPAMDCGADAYRVFLGVADGGSNLSYRANMLLRMVGSPGETPNALPLPVQVLDFSKLVVTNEPWSTSSGLTTNDVRAIVAADSLLVDASGTVTNRDHVRCGDLYANQLNVGDYLQAQGSTVYYREWTTGAHADPDEIITHGVLQYWDFTNRLGSAAYRDASEFATAADEALVHQLITNRLSGVTFDFATVAGLYLAISNIVAAQGGAITNFPAIP